MSYSIKMNIRLLACFFIIAVILIFFREIAIFTTLLIILLVGVLILFLGMKNIKNINDLDIVVKLTIIIPIVIFLMWFFYILAQVTLVLYLATVISFFIVQDWAYRTIFFLQCNDYFYLEDDWIESIWYIFGIVGIFFTAIYCYDIENYSKLSNASAIEYISTNFNSKKITLQELANINGYLENSWLDLKDFVTKSTIGIMQGLLKTATIVFAGYNFITFTIRYFALK
ncbi:hypothetical protein [Psychrobacter okhotskensis]|uniref:hypothetical protein n=1 Tax=Psychrobacter okhotskensis TaxID=212403 RepID=UPI003D02D101